MNKINSLRFRMGSLFVLFLFIATSCSYKESLTDYHPLYEVVPYHRSQIAWYDAPHWVTWALAGNDDEGIFGERCHPPYRCSMPPSLAKHFLWTCRNPFHNFCFYVIGSADRVNSEFDLIRVSNQGIDGLCYRPVGETDFINENSCFYMGFHGGKPFVSLRWVYSEKQRLDFYLGWRKRGNFGIKFIPWKKIPLQTSSECREKCYCK